MLNFDFHRITGGSYLPQQRLTGGKAEKNFGSVPWVVQDKGTLNYVNFSRLYKGFGLKEPMII